MRFNSTPLAVFDFDGTLYAGDTTLDFCRYYYLQKPWKIYWLVIQVMGWVLWKSSLINTSKFKQWFHCYLRGETEKQLMVMVQAFWQKPRKFNSQIVECLQLCSKNRLQIVLISASPEFFLIPLLKQFPINNIIGTSLTIIENKPCLGINCRGKEKLNRLYSMYPNSEIIEAYSDNEDDAELLNSAAKGFMIKNGQILLGE